MEYIQFSWLDYALFLIMFGSSLLLGIYFGCVKKQSTTKDYLHGGKNMKVFPVAMSMVAGTISGIALLSVPAEIYMYGTQFWITTWSMIFVGLAVYFIFLPVFYKLQMTSIFEYLEIRYDKRIRTVVSISSTLVGLIALPVIIYAPSLAFNQVTGFNIYLIAIIMSLICIFYTSVGGVKAVVWSDTLQFVITLCTLAFVLIKGTISVGGLAVIWKKAEQGDRLEFFNLSLNPTERTTFWNVLIGSFVTWTCLIGISQSTMQRFLSVPAYSDCKKILLIFVIFTIIVKSVSCFSGLILYAKYHDCDPFTAGYIRKPDQILPYFVSDVATKIPGLSGLFICGLFTTALSTLSTYLNSISAVIYSDVMRFFVSPDISERTKSTILKGITLAIGLIIVALVFIVEKLGTLLQLIFSLSGICSGLILGLYAMGMIFPFANKKGAFYGAVSSLVVMSVIIIGNQVMIFKKVIRIIPKPLYTYGCTTNATSVLNTSFSSITTEFPHAIQNITYSVIDGAEEQQKPFWLFNLSFHYFVLLGTAITVIVGLSASWITKSEDDPPPNPDYFCPFVHRFLKKYNHPVKKQSNIEIQGNGNDFNAEVLKELLKK